MSNPNASFVPPMSGQTVVVTGGNKGIGLATAKVLAARGAHVVLAVRDLQKGKQAASNLAPNTSVRELDLASLHSIREFASTFDGPIDILINNAGITSPTLRRTADGFELQFGTNHLGPFALTNLLLSRITGRVVTVGSLAEGMAKLHLDDLGYESTPYNEFRAYANSKLANFLFTSELQRRLTMSGSSVIATIAHPGLVASDIYKESTGLTKFMLRFAQSTDMGALPVLYAATAQLEGDTLVGPKHFMHMRGMPEVLRPSKTARNQDLAKRLWELSERLTGVGFNIGSVKLPSAYPQGDSREELYRVPVCKRVQIG